MIFDLIKHGFSIDVFISLFARVFVMFCILPFHEFAHAFVANKLGDPTARLSGRLTLNPLAHIDLFGALMIFLVGFGYAKPVPVNIRNFKKRKPYMALTAAAGPISNLIMAFIFSLFYCATFRFMPLTDNGLRKALLLFFFYVASINVSLAVFNLIPVPPLDGSRIFNAILPNKVYFSIMRYERYIFYAMFALIMLGILDKPIAIASSYLVNAILKLAAFPFGLEV